MIFVVNRLKSIQRFRKNSRLEQRVITNVTMKFSLRFGFSLSSFADHVDYLDKPAAFDISETVHLGRTSEPNEHLDQVISKHGIGDTKVDLKRVLGQG